MRNKLFYILGACLLVGLLAAIGSVAFARNPGQAVAGTEQPPLRTLTVNGTGKAFLTPDIAYINIGVQTENKDASEAVSSNNAQVQKVTAALKAAGVNEKDIQTTNFSIYPQPKFDDKGQPTGEITYVVQNTVSVTVRDISKIGELLETLKERGYLEDAVVIFTSDHGDCMGDHGLIQKWSMYDAITRVPVIAWSPNGRVRSGETVDGLCQLFDLGPTILELAGCEVPANFEARTLLPALQGRPWTPRTHVFCEQAGDVNLTGCEFITSVRSDRWKLVHFKGSTEGQLFDMVADPGEINDLWSSPEHVEVKREMLDVIRDWLIESNYQTRDWMEHCR